MAPRTLIPILIPACLLLSACDSKEKAGNANTSPAPKPAASAQPTPAPVPDSANPASGVPAFSSVRIGGKVFKLENVVTPDVRFKGLSGRTSIPDDGGMLFVFPDDMVQTMSFVMRDCPIGIDIIFLDRGMKITATHEMKPEPPRGPDEQGDGNATYEARLKAYSSGAPAQYAIELKAGTLRQISVREGQKIDLDPDLRRRAR